MTQSEFNHLLISINALSTAQMRRLIRELESRIVAGAKPAAPAAADGEETAFDVASRAGLIGCIKGAARSPTDLSTNPKHREGFGRE
jgi:hypothetical protein